MMLDQVIEPVIRQAPRIQRPPLGPRRHPADGQLALAIDRLGEQDAKLSARPHAVQLMQSMAPRMAGRPEPAHQLGDGDCVVRPADAPGREGRAVRSNRT